MNVFLADWAVGPGHFLHTLVCVLEVVGQAHVTLVTVEILGAATNLKCSELKHQNNNLNNGERWPSQVPSWW